MKQTHLTTFIILLLLAPAAHSDMIYIGLRAHSGAAKDMAKWQPTADYLTQKIPQHRFVMLPYEDLGELTRAAEQKLFDFVLTNPSSYIDLEIKYGASRILTLQNLRQEGAYTEFGAVIFTRADNNKINNLSDIKNKVFVAVSERAFGGWRMAWKEFLDHDIDPYKDFKSIIYSNGIQEDVVRNVLNGQGDAGTVRTDILEKMIADGEITTADFKILNPKTVDRFPFLLSTTLYPEWPFAKFRHTSSEIAQQVAIALLSMPSENPAAVEGQYYGWTVPLDYQPVHNLLKSLKAGAYQDYGKIDPVQLVIRYWYLLVSGIIILLLMWLIIVRILHNNKRLKIAQKELRKSKQELKHRVKERTIELEHALERAEHASMAKTHFLSRMSHELRTPMNAILAFSELIMMDKNDPISEQNKENISEIIQAGKHLLSLINEVLELSQIESGKLKFNLSEIDAEELIADCVNIVRPLPQDKNIKINNIKHNSCSLYTDATRVKQVLINLLSNAIKYNHINGDLSPDLVPLPQ